MSKALVKRDVAKLREVFMETFDDLKKQLGEKRALMWVRLSMLSARNNARIFSCTGPSLMESIMQAAHLQLRPGALHKECYLVPYWNNKIGQDECVLIPGYQGLIKLMTQDGRVKKVESRLVYPRDDFDVQFGTDPKIHHVPWPWNQPGGVGQVAEDADNSTDNPSASYSVATMDPGMFLFEMMEFDEMEQIRQASLKRTKNTGPWASPVTRPQMYRKCPIRRISNYLPRSDEFDKVLLREARAEGEIPDEEPEPQQSRTERVAEVLSAQADKTPKPQVEEL